MIVAFKFGWHYWRALRCYKLGLMNACRYHVVKAQHYQEQIKLAEARENFNDC